MLHYHDSVYGQVSLDEPVLEALVRSNAVQRLKGVLQHGITGLLGITRPITRYEHSVGVMLLLRRLGSSLKEQIAGLLHDVSHTAFSHVIDHVFSTPAGQSYHERVKAEYVAGSDLPAVLNACGYCWEDFLEDEQFPLLEQPAPALCADRLDYVLRDGMALNIVTAGEAAWVLRHVESVDRQLVVNDIRAARWLAYTFIEADSRSWSDLRAVGLYELTARAIAAGLTVGAITEADIWTSDRELWEKLKAHPDESLRRQLLNISPETRFVLDEEAPAFCVSPKIRTLDPAVGTGQQVKALSELDPEFARYRRAYLARKQKAWPMRLPDEAAT